MTRRPIGLLFAVLLSSSASAETLREAIASACATNPQLAAAQSRQEALAEAPEQARTAGRLTAEADGAAGYSRFDYGRDGSDGVIASLTIRNGGRVSSAGRAATGDVAAGAEGVRDRQAAVLETVVDKISRTDLAISVNGPNCRSVILFRKTSRAAGRCWRSTPPRRLIRVGRSWEPKTGADRRVLVRRIRI